MEARKNIAIVSAGFLFFACSQKGSVNLSDQSIKTELDKIEVAQTEKAAEKTAEKDSVWSMAPYTASLNDAINYFRANNKYKDWDPKDSKRTIIFAIIEKDGTPTELAVTKSSGVEKLDEEAIRLVRNAKISPGGDENNKPVRSKWWIVIPFPSQ